MSAKALQYYLMQDVVDGSAATVSASNAGFWPTAGDVPDYAYLSLGHIWLDTPTTSSTFKNQIVYRFGSVEQSTTQEITLFTMPIESVLFDRIKDNTTGAEETNLVIRLVRPQTRASVTPATSAFDIIQNAELRIRYLLDSNWRRLRRGTSPNVPSTGDNSLDPTFGLFCVWDGFITPPTATECQIRYKVLFRRAVPVA